MRRIITHSFSLAAVGSHSKSPLRAANDAYATDFKVAGPFCFVARAHYNVQNLIKEKTNGETHSKRSLGRYAQRREWPGQTRQWRIRRQVFICFPIRRWRRDES